MKTPLIEYNWHGVTGKWVMYAFVVELTNESKIYKGKICTYNKFYVQSLLHAYYFDFMYFCTILYEKMLKAFYIVFLLVFT